MANKYYNGVSLPELPSGLDLTAYPNVIVSKVTADGSYVMWCLTETSIYCYPSEQNFLIASASTGIIYTTTADATEWTLSEETLTFAGYTKFSYAGYEPFFATCSIMDFENYNYFLGASLPVDFYWDWSDTEGRIHATIVGESGGMEYYKILDNVYTYEQLLTMSGYMSVKGSYDTSMPFSAADIDVKTPPVIALGSVIVCPMDNCTITQGEMQITFLEKGVYSAWMIDGVDYTGGETGLNFPTVEPVVLYDGNVITVENDGVFITQNMLAFTEPIVKRDILLTTIDTEYLDTVGVVSTLEWEYFGAEFDEGFNPVFTDRKYLAVQTDAETATIGAFTESAMTGNMKVVRFLPGSINKLSREFEFSVQNPIGVGQSFQIEIVSDNASEESPTYTYSTYGSNYTVSESGLVTGVKAGSYTLYVKAEATENYHELQKSISITIQEEPVEGGGDSGESGGEVTKTERQLSATVGSSSLYVGNMTQINVSDNASGDSPAYSYESDNTEVATVNDSGLITAVGKGTATITVTGAETTNYTEGTATVQVTVIQLGIIPHEYTFDFTNADWKTLYPNNYSVVDGTTSFYVASTFTYDGKNTLRSGEISHNGTSQTTINFTLLQNGSIEFNYKVSSENNYDWLTITLDGTQIARVSGTVDWTVFSQELAVGEHVLELKYTKDGSSSNGSDAGGIGYLKIVGMDEPYAKKYLIRSNDIFYTIANGVLSALEVTELTAEVFQTHGIDTIPTWEQISELTNPDILLWYDSQEDIPMLNATMTATPNPQTLYAEPFYMTDATIFGIDSVACTYEGSLLIALSFDGGAYEHYDSESGWVTSADNEGMLPEVLMAITQDVWEAKVSGVASIQIRVILNTNTDTLQTIKFNFINEEK